MDNRIISVLLWRYEKKTLLKHFRHEFELIFVVLNDHNEFHLIILHPHLQQPFILTQRRRKKQFSRHKKRVLWAADMMKLINSYNVHYVEVKSFIYDYRHVLDVTVWGWWCWILNRRISNGWWEIKYSIEDDKIHQIWAFSLK